MKGYLNLFFTREWGRSVWRRWRKHVILLFLTLCISYPLRAQWPTDFNADILDEDCAKRLLKAEKAYNAGKFSEIPLILQDCIAQEKFSKTQKIRAFELLSLSYVALGKNRHAGVCYYQLKQYHRRYNPLSEQKNGRKLNTLEVLYRKYRPQLRPCNDSRLKPVFTGIPSTIQRSILTFTIQAEEECFSCLFKHRTLENARLSRLDVTYLMTTNDPASENEEVRTSSSLTELLGEIRLVPFGIITTLEGLQDKSTYTFLANSSSAESTGFVLPFSENQIVFKVENKAPTLTVSAIPSSIKSRFVRIELTGDDGKEGTPADSLKYRYGIENDAFDAPWRWQNTGRIVQLDQLTKGRYTFYAQAQDEFGAYSKRYSKKFYVNINEDDPEVSILNRDEFTGVIRATEVEIRFQAQDNTTPLEDMRYFAELDKDEGDHYQGIIASGWQEKTSMRYENLQAGRYRFTVQAKDQDELTSELAILNFTLARPLSPPKFEIGELHYFIYKPSSADAPTLDSVTPPMKEDLFPWVGLSIHLNNLGQQELEYRFKMEGVQPEWSTFSSNSYHYFPFQPIERMYHMSHEVSIEAINSLGERKIIKKSFTLPLVRAVPREILFTKDYDGRIIRQSALQFCFQKDYTHLELSYRINQQDWTPFSDKDCFILWDQPAGSVQLEYLVRDSTGKMFGPQEMRFYYERLEDLPFILIQNPPDSLIASRQVQFNFQGYDDPYHGDKTHEDSLIYEWRLIPKFNEWREHGFSREVQLDSLANGSYFFQVRAIDSEGNESIQIAEHFFTVNITPFFQRTKNIWAISIVGMLLAGGLSFVFVRRRTRQQLFSNRFNPYVVGEAIEDRDKFFGREAMMQDIRQALRNNSLCLVGERRIGKTSIMKRFEAEAEAPAFTFFCDLEGVKAHYFYSRIMQALITKLETVTEKAVEIDWVFSEKKREEYDDLDFEEDMNKALELLKEQVHPQSYIIMCLDEIDVMEKHSAELQQSFRNIFQTFTGEIRMLAAGVEVKKGRWALPTSPWYNFFELKEVLPLAEVDARQLITQPVSGIYSFDKAAQELILKKTDAKPYYIQRLCKQAVYRMLDRGNTRIGEQDIRWVYEKHILLGLNQEFEAFWERLSENPDVQLQQQLMQHVRGNAMQISSEQERFLRDNPYNHQHKIITASKGQLSISTIFADWLLHQHQAFQSTE